MEGIPLDETGLAEETVTCEIEEVIHKETDVVVDTESSEVAVIIKEESTVVDDISLIEKYGHTENIETINISNELEDNTVVDSDIQTKVETEKYELKLIQDNTANKELLDIDKIPPEPSTIRRKHAFKSKAKSHDKLKLKEAQTIPFPKISFVSVKQQGKNERSPIVITKNTRNQQKPVDLSPKNFPPIIPAPELQPISNPKKTSYASLFKSDADKQDSKELPVKDQYEEYKIGTVNEKIDKSTMDPKEQDALKAELRLMYLITVLYFDEVEKKRKAESESSLKTDNNTKSETMPENMTAKSEISLAKSPETESVALVEDTSDASPKTIRMSDATTSTCSLPVLRTLKIDKSTSLPDIHENINISEIKHQEEKLITTKEKETSKTQASELNLKKTKGSKEKPKTPREKPEPTNVSAVKLETKVSKNKPKTTKSSHEKPKTTIDSEDKSKTKDSDVSQIKAEDIKTETFSYASVLRTGKSGKTNLVILTKKSDEKEKKTAVIIKESLPHTVKQLVEEGNKHIKQLETSAEKDKKLDEKEEKSEEIIQKTIGKVKKPVQKSAEKVEKLLENVKKPVEVEKAIEKMENPTASSTVNTTVKILPSKLIRSELKQSDAPGKQTYASLLKSCLSKSKTPNQKCFFTNSDFPDIASTMCPIKTKMSPSPENPAPRQARKKSSQKAKSLFVNNVNY